jgi:gas vesicle protein
MKRVAKALLNALSPKEKRSKLADTLKNIIEEMRMVQNRRIERNQREQDKIEELKKEIKNYKQDIQELVALQPLFENSEENEGG